MHQNDPVCYTLQWSWITANISTPVKGCGTGWLASGGVPIRDHIDNAATPMGDRQLVGTAGLHLVFGGC